MPALTPPEVVQVFCELLDVLEYVHAKGVEHRDVKPANVIWLAVDGRLQLIDFGSAAPSSNGRAAGTTYEYRSPEMLRYAEGLSRDKPGGKTDVWSLGATLLDVATGQLLISEDGDNAQHRHGVDCFTDLAGDWSLERDLVDRFLGDGARAAWEALPAELRAVVARCLTADPARRPSTQELQQDADTRSLQAANADAHRRNTPPRPLAEAK